MDVALSIQPTPSQQQPLDKPTKHNVTGKVRVALEALVWLGLPRAQAAERAGMTEHGLYKALRKPPVKAAYMAELEVLRTSERARNIHRLVEIRDAGNNMPAVQAIDRLERMDETTAARSAGLAQFPGFVIHVSNAPVQQRVAEGVSAKHQAISTTYEEVVEPTHKPPHE